MKKDKTHYIYVITHCQTCFNKKKIFTGRLDSKLTKEGHNHANELGEKLKNKNIDIIFVSPLTRTKQTLEHIKKYHKKAKIIFDKRIIERDYGVLSGKSKQKYKKENPKMYPIYHRSYSVPPPGGESMKQVEKRVNEFIKDLLKRVNKEKTDILIIAHGNSIRPIRKYFEKLTNDEMMGLEHQRHKIFTYAINSST